MEQATRIRETQTPDYLAIVFIGAGSSYGRASTEFEAVSLAKASVEKDWAKYYVFEPDKVFTAHVFDVTGHDKIFWGDHGVFIAGDNPERIPWEDAIRVTFKLPKQRVKKRKAA
jgi:hypothetical protein